MNGKDALDHICDICNHDCCPYIHYDKSRCVFYGVIRQDLDRLKKLEDIERELGIDLIPLLTVLTNGYAFWKYDNFIYKVQIDSITNCCLKVNTWYYVNSNKNGKRYGDEFTINFKDYGKTWALTEEELENEHENI